jgi:hypothetical protein
MTGRAVPAAKALTIESQTSRPVNFEGHRHDGKPARGASQWMIRNISGHDLVGQHV